ncbi:MAG: hypothetical protein LCH93_27320 [Proteobacteria bacterium]|nr:hypothetical protein [Pseudomonadota bacterium]
MSLHWTIDSRDHLVVAVADGDVTRAEMEHYLRVLDGAHAMGYRKLFDASNSDTSMSADDLLAIGAQIRDRHSKGDAFGPLAIVISPDKSELVSRVLGILAAAERPMRVFESIEPARRWIESFPK